MNSVRQNVSCTSSQGEVEMRIRPLMLAVVAVVLTGCFQSDDELWPIKGGEELLLPEGN